MAVARRIAAVYLLLATRAGAAEAVAAEASDEATWWESVKGRAATTAASAASEMDKASEVVSNTTTGWLKASQNATETTWTKMRNVTGSALWRVEHSACDYKVSQDIEEVNRSLTDQLQSDCGSSTSWIPLVGAHVRGACTSMGQWNVDRTLRQQRSKLMEDCLKCLQNKPGDVVSGVAAWSRRSKESLKQRVAPAIQSAIHRAQETVRSRGSYEAKFSLDFDLDGPLLSLVFSPATGVVTLLLLAAIAVCLMLRHRRTRAYRSLLVVDEDLEVSDIEETGEFPTFGMLSA